MATEFATKLRKSLTRGLRPDFRTKQNSGFQTTLKNGKPSEFGILPCDPVINPFHPNVLNAAGITVQWPNPIMHKGEKWTILATDQQFFYVNEDSWELAWLDIYDFANQSTVVQPLIGAQWQFASAFDTWFATNGKNTIFSSNHQVMAGGAKKIYRSTVSTFETCCQLNGRFIMAGFDPDNFFSTTWETFLRNQVSTNVDPAFKTTSLDLGENFILWSSIGGGDWPLWLFDQNFAEDSYLDDGSVYSSANPIFYDKLKQGTWGFAPCQWQGLVKKVLPLGNGFMAYGESGISYFPQVSEPLPTFGQQVLKPFGIHGHAAGGDRFEQIFIDQRGDIWRVRADLSIEKLGYREFISPMLSSEINISQSFESDLGREYFICDGVKTYVLTPQGLGESTQLVPSTIYSQGATLGPVEYDQFNEDREFLLISDWMDFGDGSGIKRIGWIETGITNETGVTVQLAVDYRYKKHDLPTRTRFVNANHEGAAYINASGIDFRVVVKISDYIDFELSEIIVRRQLTDRRFVRSGSANITEA